MGDVYPAPIRGRAVQLDAARRRQGRAARGGRTEELEGAALDRPPGAEGLMTMAQMRSLFTSPWRGEVAGRSPAGGGELSFFTPPRLATLADPPPPGEGEDRELC